MIRFNASARYVHAAGPMLFMLCLVAINYKRPGLYKQLVIEDGIVEWATVVVYVMAAVLGMGLCRRLLDTIGLGGALGSLVLSRLGWAVVWIATRSAFREAEAGRPAEADA